MSLLRTTAPRAARRDLCARCLQRQRSSPQTTWPFPQPRTYASDTLPAPPLLLKLRKDLKAAMKDKDSNRLAVLRGLLADITNASKTSSPMKTDMQILSLLRKRAAASKAASVEFDGAGRQDLKEKEEAQVLILDEYAGGVPTVDESVVRTDVEQVRKELSSRGDKVDKPVLLKKTIAPGGIYEGKNVDKAMVARIVQEVLSGEVGKKQ